MHTLLLVGVPENLKLDFFWNWVFADDHISSNGGWDETVLLIHESGWQLSSAPGRGSLPFG